MPCQPSPNPSEPRTVTLPLPLALRLLGALDAHAPPEAPIRADGSLRDLESRIRDALRAGRDAPRLLRTPASA